MTKAQGFVDPIGRNGILLCLAVPRFLCLFDTLGILPPPLVFGRKSVQTRTNDTHDTKDLLPSLLVC